MSEMSERVAKAIAEAIRPEAAIRNAVYLEAAKRAIEAMREPDETMKAAGAEFFEEGNAKQNGFAAAIVYQAMVEATLPDRTEPPA